MTQQEHIQSLIVQAREDFGAANALKNAGYYAHALFCVHLVLEKLCKAVWVKRNQSVRYPYIHNLLKLLKDSHVELTIEQAEFYAEMNQFQALGRYEEDLMKKEATINKEVCEQYLELTQTEILWLENLTQ